jgi:hypothetical protein
MIKKIFRKKFVEGVWNLCLFCPNYQKRAKNHF